MVPPPSGAPSLRRKARAGATCSDIRLAPPRLIAPEKRRRRFPARKRHMPQCGLGPRKSAACSWPSISRFTLTALRLQRLPLRAALRVLDAAAAQRVKTKRPGWSAQPGRGAAERGRRKMQRGRRRGKRQRRIRRTALAAAKRRRISLSDLPHPAPRASGPISAAPRARKLSIAGGGIRGAATVVGCGRGGVAGLAAGGQVQPVPGRAHDSAQRRLLEDRTASVRPRLARLASARPRDSEHQPAATSAGWRSQ